MSDEEIAQERLVREAFAALNEGKYLSKNQAAALALEVTYARERARVAEEVKGLNEFYADLQRYVQTIDQVSHPPNGDPRQQRRYSLEHCRLCGHIGWRESGAFSVVSAPLGAPPAEGRQASPDDAMPTPWARQGPESRGL